LTPQHIFYIVEVLKLDSGKAAVMAIFIGRNINSGRVSVYREVYGGVYRTQATLGLFISAGADDGKDNEKT
jgi:hypothetical protein